jgi:hypothetical protein
VVASAWENVAFGATGRVTLAGANPFASDAGIASIVAQTEPGAGAVHALAIVRAGDAVRVLHASAAVSGPTPAHEVRYTTDGSEPGPASARYDRPLGAVPPVRAALLVAGRTVAVLDERAPKLRMRGSAPPESPREPFRHGQAPGRACATGPRLTAPGSRRS